MPKFSFITIAFNEEQYINNLLNDLKAQDYPHNEIEVILVDSNSTDSTKTIMNKFAESSDFFRCCILDNPKKVLACGWNIALEEACGEVIVKIDGHGRIGPDFLTNVAKEIDSGENIVGGQRITVFDGETKWSKILAHAECSIFGSGVASYRRKCDRKYVKTLGHAAYRKIVFDTVGGFNENFVRTEDNEIHYRMREAGFKFCQSPDICSYLHARSSLKAMLKQKKGNGWWIGLTFPKCPKCLSLYNFVPLAFVVAIILSLALGIVTDVYWPLALVLASYFFAAIGATIIEIKKEKDKSLFLGMLLLPILFFLMHLYYGIFTLFGLLYSPFFKTNKEKK